MTSGNWASPGPFVPAGAFTGIGSLPFTDPQEAVSFVAERSPGIPFWPQMAAPDMVGALFSQTSAAFSPQLLNRPGRAGYEVSEEDLAQLKIAAAGPPAPLPEAQVPGFFAFHRAARQGAFARARVDRGSRWLRRDGSPSRGIRRCDAHWALGRRRLGRPGRSSRAGCARRPRSPAG
jgi:hypothetical protein